MYIEIIHVKIKCHIYNENAYEKMKIEISLEQKIKINNKK